MPDNWTLSEDVIAEISKTPLTLVEDVVWAEILAVHRETEALYSRIDKQFGQMRVLLDRKHRLMEEFEKLRKESAK